MVSKAQVMTESPKMFSKKDLQAIEILEEEQRNFKSFVDISKDYSENEKAAIQFDTVAEFDAFWQDANNAKGSFDKSHEKGWGRLSKGYQTSAVMVRSFMKDFSPIIEVVKEFSPYGGMAVGTISVLFVVAANKDELEENLASTLQGIRDRLPGMKLYQHIYNGDHELDMQLQARIVSAYQGFIGFCIEAVKYYKRSRLRRWMKTLGRPNTLLDKVKDVQDTIVGMRHLCDELLDKETATIHQLKDDIDKLLKAQEDSRLYEVRRLLGLLVFSDERQREDLNNYRQTLNSDEQLNAAFFEQMRGPRLDLFKACPEYSSWFYSQHSSLLILSGHNNESITYLDQCWLSPIAVTMVEELSFNDSETFHAYYIFSPSGESLYPALSVILLQMIRQRIAVLRDESQYNELRAELHKWNDNEQETKSHLEADDRKLSALRKVIRRVICFFEESDTVYIILDRVDRCCDLKKKLDHRKILLKVLVEMVKVARCKLRLLVVINGDQWDVEQKMDDIEDKMEGRVVVHTLEQGYSA